jgi:AcrR family transcriptional regulator
MTTIKSVKRKSTTKANSPVKITGVNSLLKKRLIKADSKDLTAAKEKIINAARVCFARQGFAGTSIKDIQEASGFSRGNLYHHFKTKEEIVQIIIEQNLGIFLSRIKTILDSLENSGLRLSDVIEELASFAEEITKGPGKGMAFHVWSLAMVDVDVRKTMVDFFEQIRLALEEKLKILIKQGEIPKNQNPQTLSVALFGIVIPGFTLQSVYMDEKSIHAAEYANALKALFKESN